MSRYNKLWVALIGAGITALAAYTGTDFEAEGVTPAAVMSILTPVLTAFGVWAAPNSPA